MQQDAQPKKKFNQLSSAEKMKFVGKLMVFIISFGFAFPLLLND